MKHVSMLLQKWISMGMKREIMTFIKDPDLQTTFNQHKEKYKRFMVKRKKEVKEKILYLI